MGYVLLENATGRILEYQELATPGTLLANITNNPQYGFVVADVEERQVTNAEYETLQATWDADPTNPDKIARDAAAGAKAQKEADTKTTLGLTDAQFQDLKDSMK